MMSIKASYLLYVVLYNDARLVIKKMPSAALRTPGDYRRSFVITYGFVKNFTKLRSLFQRKSSQTL